MALGELKEEVFANKVSISSAFYVQIFRTNVVLAASLQLHVPRKKMPK